MPNYPLGHVYPGYCGFLHRERREGAQVIRTCIYPTQNADFPRRLANYFSFVLSAIVAGSLLLPRATYLLIESPPLFLGFAGIWLSRLKKARLIFNVSDLWPESAVQLGLLQRQSMAYRLSAQLEALCYRKAWLVTGQSQSIVANIRERFPDVATFHLSNGVDTALFHPGLSTQAARLVLGGTEGCIALYAGLHGLAQGLDQLLCAADELRGEDGLQFVLIGDGPEKGRLLELARARNLSNVRFLAPRPAVEIPALLAAADIILVTLKKDIPGAVPSKLYEAMASGRPVVLAAGGEAASIVRQHRAGIVVDPGDVSGLAQAVRTLQNRPDLRRELGANARRAAEHLFDRAKIVGRFIEYLEANS